MARKIENSLRKLDNGKNVPPVSEIILIDHSDFGLVFGLLNSSSGELIGLYNDLSLAEEDRHGMSFLPKGISPAEMSQSVSVRKAIGDFVRFSSFSEQSVGKHFLKKTRVLFANKSSV